MNKPFQELKIGDSICLIFRRPPGTRSCAYVNMTDDNTYTIIELSKVWNGETEQIRVLDDKGIPRWWGEDEILTNAEIRDYRLKTTFDELNVWKYLNPRKKSIK